MSANRRAHSNIDAKFFCAPFVRYDLLLMPSKVRLDVESARVWVDFFKQRGRQSQLDSDLRRCSGHPRGISACISWSANQ